MQRKDRSFFRVRIIFAGLLSLLMITTQAGTPLWTFDPLTSTTVTVPNNSTRTVQVQYRVTNQSNKKTHTLTMLPIQGITQITAGSGICGNPFVLPPKGSCILSLLVTSSQLSGSISGGPIVCQVRGGFNQCYRPSAANILRISVVPGTILSISVTELAIAKQGIFTSLSGAGPAVSKARQLIITNTGSVTAQDVKFSINPALPAGTIITPATCGDIAPGGTCTLTITPGTVASTEPTPPGTAPTPSTLTASGTNTNNTVTSNIIILTYGNIFKGGYVFSIDDSTPITQSVGGKAAFTSDQAGTFLWATVNDNTAADSTTDGQSNTNKLAVPVGQYPAAQECLNFEGNGFVDWYLPAICEMGYDGSGFGSTCGSSTTPTIQNLDSNLDNQGFGSFAPFTAYWSSSEDAISPANAWVQNFTVGQQFITTKNATSNPIRCVRIFTP